MSLPFHSEDEPEIKQMPFKVRPSPEPGILGVTIFPPWSMAELRAIIKGFPKPKENPQTFYEELRIRIGAYDPGLRVSTNLFIRH